MTKGTATTRALTRRALLIFGALVSLCVSENVGPRLLPLPASPEVAAQGASDPGQTISRASSKGKSAGARVQIVSNPQSRAGVERHASVTATRAEKFDLAPPPNPAVLRRGLHPTVPESTAPFSRPKGRAPPRLA